MWFSLSDQTAYFLWSLVLGLSLGAAYDVVRAARMLLRAGRAHLLVSDVLFFTFCGVVTSLFALPFNKGDVRAFIIFGEAVGFLCYRLTLGGIMGRFYAFLSVFLRGIVQKTGKILEKIFSFLLKATARLVYNVGVIIDKLHQHAAEKRKKRRAAAKADQLRGRRKRKDKKHEQKHRRKKAGHRGKKQSRRRTERR